MFAPQRQQQRETTKNETKGRTPYIFRLYLHNAPTTYNLRIAPQTFRSRVLRDTRGNYYVDSLRANNTKILLPLRNLADVLCSGGEGAGRG